MCFGQQPSWCHFVAERDDRGREKEEKKMGRRWGTRRYHWLGLCTLHFPLRKGIFWARRSHSAAPGLREDGAEEQPGHQHIPPHSATRKITRQPMESLQGDKHEIPTQMGGMDVVMAKGEVLAITHSDRLRVPQGLIYSFLSEQRWEQWPGMSQFQNLTLQWYVSSKSTVHGVVMTIFRKKRHSINNEKTLNITVCTKSVLHVWYGRCGPVVSTCCHPSSFLISWGNQNASTLQI